MTVSPVDHRSNNFDGLRLIGALVVVFGHAYPLMGMNERVPMVLGYPIQTLGVIIFFAISGYLITASWDRTRNPLTYLLARSLRIFPALAVVVVVTVFVIGPLQTTLTREEYFAQPRTWDYLWNIGLKVQYDLPGVFTDIPYPIAANGSLWSLPVEFACYLLVPLLLLVPGRLRWITLTAGFVYSLHLAQQPPEQTHVIWGTPLNMAASMWVFFAVGALLRVVHQRHRGIFRTDVAVVVMAAYVVVLATVPEWQLEVAPVALSYVVLTVGLARTPVLRHASRFGDVSYGLYLWAFPVQQVLMSVTGPLPLSANLAIVVTITTILAFGSWHLVEKPSLALKQRIVRPRRRGAKVEQVVDAVVPPVLPEATERPASASLV